MVRGFSRNLCIGVGLASLATTVTSPDARAYLFYFDVQAGASEFLSTSYSFLSPGGSGASDVGLGANLGVSDSPIEPHGGMDFQFGITTLYDNVTQATNNYGILAPYGAFRIQFLSAYATLGITPFVWRRSMQTSGVDNFSQAPNTLAYLGELGVLYSATPKFSLGAALNLQWFTVSGSSNAQPAASLNFVMRFYFNLFNIGNDGPGSATPLEYSGWDISGSELKAPYGPKQTLLARQIGYPTAKAGGKRSRLLGQAPDFRKVAQAKRIVQALQLLRRPSLCDRPSALRPLARGRLEGHRPTLLDHERLRRPSPLWLGLPWRAGRV